METNKKSISIIILSCCLLIGIALLFTKYKSKHISKEETKLIRPCLENDFCNVKYLSNYDGDTIKLDIGQEFPEIFRYINVRLNGIDTPEIRGKTEKERRAAKIAKEFVQAELSKAVLIDLRQCEKDKYFRLNCQIEYDRKNLTKELLKRNYGYEYHGGKKDHKKNFY